MPVDMPQPALPVMESSASLQGAHRFRETLSFRGKLLHLSADRWLWPDAIAEVVKPAESLEEALAAIEVLYYREGFPATRLHFAVDGHDVYILIRVGSIKELRGESEHYARYFRDLIGRKPLEISDLGARVSLASEQADRAGVDVPLSFESLPDGSEALLIGKPNKIERQGRLRADFNNFGNRYAGRYQSSLSARYATLSGNQGSVSVSTGLRDLARDDTVGPYHAVAASLGHVGPWGILELSGDYAKAQSRPDNLRLNQDIWRAGLSWAKPLYADLFTQFNLQLRAEAFYKSTRDDASDTLLQEERYPAVTVTPSYARMVAFDKSHLMLKLGIDLQQGLKPGTPELSNAQMDYTLLRPAMAVEYFRNYWDLSLSLRGQLTSDRLPEQQQWVLGGPGNMYAYLPGAAVGDVGGLAGLKLHRSAFGFYGVGFEPSAFIEYGSSRFVQARSGNRPDGIASLADAGLKLSIMPTQFFNCTVSATRELYASKKDTLSPNAERNMLYFRATLEY